MPDALPERRAGRGGGLAAALPDLDVVGAEVVPLAKARAGMLFGTGKVEELRARFARGEVDLVLVDGPVSPVQQRNLEKAWKVKLLDRTGLILEIFADRARTREGVLQVELARAQLSAHPAGAGLDPPRAPARRLRLCRRPRRDPDRGRPPRASTSRSIRIKPPARQGGQDPRRCTAPHGASVPFPVVALVGYTNAGKSTLFNRLTGAEVLAKDMLFATLDPTMRGDRPCRTGGG